MSILYRPPVSWELLVALEPRLQAVKSIEEVGRLVGWTACTRHPVLRTSDAYHVALDELIANGVPAFVRSQVPVLEACA